MMPFNRRFLAFPSLTITALFVFFGVFFGGIEARAQFHTGPIASAIGGAGRAAVDPGEAGFLNPAGLAHLKDYYVSGNYGLGEHPNEGNHSQWGILLADNSPGNTIAGAFSYQRKKTELSSGLNFVEQDLQFGLGSLVYHKIAVGAAVHRLYYQPDGGTDYTQDNAHLGLLYTPLENLGLSFTAYDVFTASDNVPIGIRVVPTFALGSHLMLYDILRLRLDLVRPDKFNNGHRTNVMAGLETYFREDFAFRFGGQWRETEDQMWVTAGLGFKGPKLSFDYTFEKDVRRAEGTRHLFDLWLPF